MSWGALSTVVLFIAFIVMTILLFSSPKAYENAGNLALKDDEDEIITPRNTNKNEANT